MRGLLANVAWHQSKLISASHFPRLQGSSPAFVEKVNNKSLSDPLQLQSQSSIHSDSQSQSFGGASASVAGRQSLSRSISTSLDSQIECVVSSGDDENDGGVHSSALVFHPPVEPTADAVVAATGLGDGYANMQHSELVPSQMIQLR